MTQQSIHNETAKVIDHFLLGGEFDGLALNEKGKYHGWYATFLTGASLLAAGSPIKYAHADFELSMPDVRITAFTSNLVIVTHVDLEFDGVPVVRGFSRNALQTLDLSASERMDSRDGRSREWPGTIVLKLRYCGLHEPIEIVGHGVNIYKVDEPSALVELVSALTADLIAD